MRKKPPKLLLQALAKKADARHSDVYRWFQAHHTELSVGFKQHRPSWSRITEGLTAQGLVSVTGQKLNSNSVRQTWDRLCRDLVADEKAVAVAMEAAAAAERLGVGRRDSPARRTVSAKDWKPTPVAVMPSPSGPPPDATPPPFAPTPTKPGPVGGSAEARLDMLDQLFGDFDKRSGR